MRYHLFTGQNYYPESGLGDYAASYDSLEEAVEQGKAAVAAMTPGEPYRYHNDWYVVVSETDGSLQEEAGGHTKR